MRRAARTPGSSSSCTGDDPQTRARCQQHRPRTRRAGRSQHQDGAAPVTVPVAPSSDQPQGASACAVFTDRACRAGAQEEPPWPVLTRCGGRGAAGRSLTAALRLGGRPCGERRRAFRLAEAEEYLCMRPLRPLEESACVPSVSLVRKAQRRRGWAQVKLRIRDWRHTSRGCRAYFNSRESSTGQAAVTVSAPSPGAANTT